MCCDTSASLLRTELRAVLCRAVACIAVQSDLMSAGARLGMPSTEEAALLSSVLHAYR